MPYVKFPHNCQLKCILYLSITILCDWYCEIIFDKCVDDKFELSSGLIETIHGNVQKNFLLHCQWK